MAFCKRDSLNIFNSWDWHGSSRASAWCTRSLLSGFDVGTLLLSISELDETWDGTNESGTAVTRVSTRRTHSLLPGFNAGALLLSISELDEL
jgi:hypothetical protein